MTKSAFGQTLITLIFCALAYIFIFLAPNSQGAKDLPMLSTFAPDEFAQYPRLMGMLDQPADSFLQSVYRFIQYKHYYYGYPFYLYSALFALLPLRLFEVESISIDLLALRQIVSVLPMLASLAVLVYMQTKFRDWFRSILLFLFLLTVPMVTTNSLWWHPESLVFLFVTLTLFFLQRDNLAFGRNFYYAALFCGLASATKLIGFFFFAAIPAYLFLGWFQKKINIKAGLNLAFKFIFLMGITFFVCNPFLFFKSERDAALQAQMGQAQATSSGFMFSSGKSPVLWLPVIKEYYAQVIFLALAAFAMLVGIFDKERSLINLLIALWSIPFSLYLLFFVELRHPYYLLPAFLPLFSTLPAVVDWMGRSVKVVSARWLIGLIFVGLFVNQLFYNLNYAQTVYAEAANKEANSAALSFYAHIDKAYLSRIVLNRQLYIYRSVRVYIADAPRWIVKYRWYPTDYSYIQKSRPDVIVLWRQEVFDYTNADVIAGADLSKALEKSLPFYMDARKGALQGYELLYQDDFGMLFVSRELADAFFRDFQ